MIQIWKKLWSKNWDVAGIPSVSWRISGIDWEWLWWFGLVHERFPTYFVFFLPWSRSSLAGFLLFSSEICAHAWWTNSISEFGQDDELAKFLDHGLDAHCKYACEIACSWMYMCTSEIFLLAPDYTGHFSTVGQVKIAAGEELNLYICVWICACVSGHVGLGCDACYACLLEYLCKMCHDAAKVL